MADYRSAVEEIRRLEQKVLEYEPYSGKMEIIRAVDLSPEEFADFTYQDLINLYERTEKITAAARGIMYRAEPEKPAKAPAKGAAAPPAPKPPKAAEAKIAEEKRAKAGEVEEKMKAITTKALAEAKEMGAEMEKKPIEVKAPPPPEKGAEEIELDILGGPPLESRVPWEEEKKMPEAAREEMPAGIEIEREAPAERAAPAAPEKGAKPRPPSLDELEMPPPGQELEIERPAEEKKPEREIEFEREEERKAPAKKPEAPELETGHLEPEEAPALEEPAEEAHRAAPVPPVLAPSAEEEAARKLEGMERNIRDALGGKVDETELKKRMLQLTKELFKEKSFNRREQIKNEIAVLKNMLSGVSGAPAAAMAATRAVAGRAAPAKAPAAVDRAARDQLLETLSGTQMMELSAAKETVLSTYRSRLKRLRSIFSDRLRELPEEKQVERKRAYEKYVFDLTALSEQLPQVIVKYRDSSVRKHRAEIAKFGESLGAADAKLKARVDERLNGLDADYAKQFDTAKEIAGKDINTSIELGGREVFRNGGGGKDAEAQEAVEEISGTDEGTLLYYLHSKDPQYYKAYERRHIAKGEALSRAKALMAKEKGLSDDMIRKYFTDMEG